MADKSAKAHTHQSNRERPRKATEKKVVYKSVLENPFRIRWLDRPCTPPAHTHLVSHRPSVPVNLQNIIFSHLTSLLDGAAAYHEAQSKSSRKRKRGLQNVGSKKKAKNSEAGEDVPMKGGETAQIQTTTEAPDDLTITPQKPVVLTHIICGINAVTKRLEAQARKARRNVIIATDSEEATQVPITLVFVCRADVDPSILIDHFPPLVAACNSVRSNLSQLVKMVPVPKGSEDVLAAKLGIKRVSVIALDVRIFMLFH